MDEEREEQSSQNKSSRSWKGVLSYLNTSDPPQPSSKKIRMVADTPEETAVNISRIHPPAEIHYDEEGISESNAPSTKFPAAKPRLEPYESIMNVDFALTPLEDIVEASASVGMRKIVPKPEKSKLTFSQKLVNLRQSNIASVYSSSKVLNGLGMPILDPSTDLLLLPAGQAAATLEFEELYSLTALDLNLAPAWSLKVIEKNMVAYGRPNRDGNNVMSVVRPPHKLVKISPSMEIEFFVDGMPVPSDFSSIRRIYAKEHLRHAIHEFEIKPVCLGCSPEKPAADQPAEPAKADAWSAVAVRNCYGVGHSEDPILRHKNCPILMKKRSGRCDACREVVRKQKLKAERPEVSKLCNNRYLTPEELEKRVQEKTKMMHAKAQKLKRLAESVESEPSDARPESTSTVRKKAPRKRRSTKSARVEPSVENENTGQDAVYMV